MFYYWTSLIGVVLLFGYFFFKSYRIGYSLGMQKAARLMKNHLSDQALIAQTLAPKNGLNIGIHRAMLCDKLALEINEIIRSHVL